MTFAAADPLPLRDHRLLRYLRSWREVDVAGLPRSADLDVWLPPGDDQGVERAVAEAGA